MDYLKSYYSLEKHLEDTVKINPQFEILNAIWKLNKKNLASALSNVNQYFPHYSLHEKSHSDTIVSNIESFLGEKRIKNLSPTDTWLILMAAFTHDLGMVVFHELIEKEWSSKTFQFFLQEVSEWDDPDMKASGQLLLKLQNLSKSQKLDDTDGLSSLAAIEIKKSVTLIVAEYIRRIHHKRSSEILSGIDKVFFQVTSSFYSDQIPGRLLSILAEVAYLHGVEFYEILKRLDFQANGLANDKIHPRFIAAMLRLGDLLDIDDSRFNLFTGKVFDLPENSTLHKKKHSSTKHFLITPEAIEITSDCPDERVYRLARSWFDWLEEEVENQSREWSNIAPNNLGGSAPRIPKGKIKVFYKKRADESLINLRFHISNEKIFEILEGASIYENAEFTFIRELVQNALDASKIQLWKEIEKGTYDFVFREHSKNPLLTHNEIIAKIKFPSDVPTSLLNSYNIKLSFKWEDFNKSTLLIIVEDQGTGISNVDLIRMTARVGESRKGNLEYQEMLARMPFWLKPTGAFGIGLQSVFIVSDSFNVQTKSEGEESKEIIFKSAKKGKYSTLTGETPDMQRGTKVVVAIPKIKFPEVFRGSFDWGITMDYDYFTDEHGTIYIPKIKMYIDDILQKINTLQINFFDDGLLHVSNDFERKIIDCNISEDQSIYCSLMLHEKELVFDFFEDKVGSQFSLVFPSDIEEDLKDKWMGYKTEYFVRDIPVKSNKIRYSLLSYSKLTWNFMSPESDKILNLSRDKFLLNRMGELEKKLLNKVIPVAIELAEKLLLNNKEKLIKSYEDDVPKLALIYFKLMLTKKLNGLTIHSLDVDYLQDTALPKEMISYLNDGTLRMASFFDLKKVVIPVTNYTHVKQLDLSLKTDLISNIKETLTNIPIIWNDDFFSIYFSKNFTITAISFFKTGYILTMENIHSLDENIRINNGYDLFLRKLINNPHGKNRVWQYAIEKYADKLAIKNRYVTGFENFPYLSKSSIISPFYDKNAYNELKNFINNQSSSKEKNIIENILTDDLIKKYATPALINWIIDSRLKSEPVKKLTENLIIEGYRELITDMILANI